MIAQGGLYLQDAAVTDPEAFLAAEMFDAEGSLLVRKGKKKYFRLVVK